MGLDVDVAVVVIHDREFTICVEAFVSYKGCIIAMLLLWASDWIRCSVSSGFDRTARALQRGMPSDKAPDGQQAAGACYVLTF